MGDDELVGDEEWEGEGEGQEAPEGVVQPPVDDEEGEGGGEEEDEMVLAMEEELEEEGNSNMMVEYNRQYYFVPNRCKVRDYKRLITAPSEEVLGEMVASQASATKWPLASTIDPAAVVVLKGKFKKDDAAESYAWYCRIVVEGNEEGDDQYILRHMPKGVCKEFVKYLSEDSDMSTSRLVTDYQSPDNNQRVLVPLKETSNWEVVPQGKLPRSCAIKPPGQGGKTKADAPARGGDGGDKETPAPKKGSAASLPKKSVAPPKKPAHAPVKPAKPAKPAPAPVKPAPAPAPVKPATTAPAAGGRGKGSLGKPSAAKQTTLLPVYSKASTSNAAGKKPVAAPSKKPAPEAAPPQKGPTPVPSEDEEEEPPPPPTADGNKEPVPKGALVSHTKPWPMVARDTDCVERCVREEQTITHTYKGFNEAADKYEPGQFLINKVMIPITASSYTVTVEYTLPALEG